jgi:peptidyl-prolyl cis-trans isomerase B (cyclophilin B)
MKKSLSSLLVATLAALVAPALLAEAPAQAPAQPAKNPVVVIKTSMGTIKAELYPDKAPITVKNFLQYASEKFYDGLIFHRVINGFMIQGGGHDAKLAKKATRAPIKNEAKTSPKNTVGTLAMGQIPGDQNSATSQFFINVSNNQPLDYRGEGKGETGYCVFGKVTDGMDVVNKIKAVPTGVQNGMADVPLTAVVIESIRLEK